MASRVVSVNAGGRLFQTSASTLQRFPTTAFAQAFAGAASRSGMQPSAVSPKRRGSAAKSARSKKRGGSAAPVFGSGAAQTQYAAEQPVFVDVDPAVFESVLNFLRIGSMTLPTNNEPLRSAIVHYLTETGLLPHAFPSVAANEDSSRQDDATAAEQGNSGEAPKDQDNVVVLPDVCVVQLCDHMQHDQGVKRHAITISYGADGFCLRNLAKRIRRDLNTQLASTYWQVYQTNERAAFFVTTKVANGTADLMTTSITQQVIEHTEKMGYSLASSYVTLSPDVVHTNVRMLIHNFIFRRVRLPVPDAGDGDALMVVGNTNDQQQNSSEDSFERQVHPNFEPRAVGPQKTMWEGEPSVVPPGERVRDIWKK